MIEAFFSVNFTEFFFAVQYDTVSFNVQTMNLKLEIALKDYLLYGDFPATFSSNKHNFITLAKKHTVNKKENLLRDGKPVVMERMQNEIFDALHQHSGRTNTWVRIKER